MALVFSSPLITLIIEWVVSHFSRAKKWAIQFISAFVLLAGVFFVIQPPFMKFNQKEESVSDFFRIYTVAKTNFLFKNTKNLMFEKCEFCEK